MPTLFLSHLSRDKKAVEEIARRIEASPEARAHDLRVWYDRPHLFPGDGWQEQLEKAINETTTAFAVYLGASGIENWVGPEVRLAITRHVRQPDYAVIPVFAEAEPNLNRYPGFLTQFHGVRDVLQDPAELAKLVKAAAGLERDRPVRLVDEPFVGLRAFEERDNQLFFGREQEIEELVERLRSNRLLMVVGDSGSGKSSLVRAGLVPAFRGGALADRWSLEPDDVAWRAIITRPGGDAINRLACDLNDANVAMPEPVDAQTRSCIRELVRSKDPEKMCDALFEAMPPNTQILLVIDQFEELFTLCNDEQQRALVSFIRHLTAPHAARPVRVVLTMRRDYYNLCSQNAEFYEALERNKYTVRRMTKEGLRDCVAKPLHLADFDDCELLIDKILKDIGDQPGEIALLQVALAESWRRRNQSGEDLLETYVRIGGVSGTLATLANELFVEQLDEQQREDAKVVFLRLATLGDAVGAAKRIAGREEFSDQQWAFVQRLASKEYRRLVMIGGPDATSAPSHDHEGPDGGTAELSHDALITQWPRYQNWLRDEAPWKRVHDQIIADAAEWKSGGDLLAGRRLAEASDLANQRRTWLSPTEWEFIKLSRRAEANRRRWAGVVCLAIVALFLAALTLGWRMVYLRGKWQDEELKRRQAHLDMVRISQELEAEKLKAAAAAQRASEEKVKEREDALKRERLELDRYAARNILGEIKPTEDQPGKLEFGVWRRLAEEREGVRLAFVGEILRDRATAALLERRLPYALHAAVGLDVGSRDKVLEAICQHGKEPAPDGTVNFAVVTLGSLLGVDNAQLDDVVVRNLVALVKRTPPTPDRIGFLRDGWSSIIDRLRDRQASLAFSAFLSMAAESQDAATQNSARPVVDALVKRLRASDRIRALSATVDRLRKETDRGRWNYLQRTAVGILSEPGKQKLPLTRSDIGEIMAGIGAQAIDEPLDTKFFLPALRKAFLDSAAENCPPDAVDAIFAGLLATIGPNEPKELTEASKSVVDKLPPERLEQAVAALLDVVGRAEQPEPWQSSLWNALYNFAKWQTENGDVPRVRALMEKLSQPWHFGAVASGIQSGTQNLPRKDGQLREPDQTQTRDAVVFALKRARDQDCWDWRSDAGKGDPFLSDSQWGEILATHMQRIQPPFDSKKLGELATILGIVRGNLPQADVQRLLAGIIPVVQRIGPEERLHSKEFLRLVVLLARLLSTQAEKPAPTLASQCALVLPWLEGACAGKDFPAHSLVDVAKTFDALGKMVTSEQKSNVREAILRKIKSQPPPSTQETGYLASALARVDGDALDTVLSLATRGAAGQERRGLAGAILNLVEGSPELSNEHVRSIFSLVERWEAPAADDAERGVLLRLHRAVCGKLTWSQCRVPFESLAKGGKTPAKVPVAASWGTELPPDPQRQQMAALLASLESPCNGSERDREKCQAVLQRFFEQLPRDRVPAGWEGTLCAIAQGSGKEYLLMLQEGLEKLGNAMEEAHCQRILPATLSALSRIDTPERTQPVAKGLGTLVYKEWAPEARSQVCDAILAAMNQCGNPEQLKCLGEALMPWLRPEGLGKVIAMAEKVPQSERAAVLAVILLQESSFDSDQLNRCLPIILQGLLASKDDKYADLWISYLCDRVFSLSDRTCLRAVLAAMERGIDSPGLTLLARNVVWEKRRCSAKQQRDAGVSYAPTIEGIVQTLERSHDHQQVQNLLGMLSALGEKLTPEQIRRVWSCAQHWMIQKPDELVVLTEKLVELPGEWPAEVCADVRAALTRVMQNNPWQRDVVVSIARCLKKLPGELTLEQFKSVLNALAPQDIRSLELRDLPAEALAILVGKCPDSAVPDAISLLLSAVEGNPPRNTQAVLLELAQTVDTAQGVSILKSVAASPYRGELADALGKKDKLAFEGDVWKAVAWAEKEKAVVVRNAPRFPLTSEK